MTDTLTTDQLAARWGMSPQTLENWRSSRPRKGPDYIKLGDGRSAIVVYRIADVILYERKHRIKGGG